MSKVTTALKALSEDSADQYTETIIKALTLYQQWMDGFARVNRTFGDAEFSSECVVQADKAQKLLNQLNKENN